MPPWVRMGFGIVLLVGGLFIAFGAGFALAIGDCGPACVARGERAFGFFVVLAALAAAGGGVFLLKKP